jgi:hypothetical protein
MHLVSPQSSHNQCTVVQKKLLASKSSSGTIGSQEDLPQTMRVTGDYAFSYTARSRAEPSPGGLHLHKWREYAPGLFLTAVLWVSVAGILV